MLGSHRRTAQLVVMLVCVLERVSDTITIAMLSAHTAGVYIIVTTDKQVFFTYPIARILCGLRCSWVLSRA